LPVALGQLLIVLNVTTSEKKKGFLLIEVFERQMNHTIMATWKRVAIFIHGALLHSSVT
jgi:hypothetical protein